MTKPARTFATTLALAILVAAPAISDEHGAELASGPEEARNLLELTVAAAETRAGAEAIDYAEMLFRGPYPDAVRLRAALLIADMHATEGRFAAAKFWARRAYDLGKSPQERGAVAQLYNRIAAASPLSVSASLSFAPSSNVNNGGTTNVIVIGGFPFTFGESSLQLSGVEATGSLSLTYRLGQSPASLTEGIAEASFRKVWLDPDAAEAAPDVGSTDFDQIGLSVGLRHSWQFAPGLGPTRASMSFGSGLRAGEPVSSWRSLDLLQTAVQSDTSSLRFNLGLRTEDRLDAPISSSASRQVGGTYQYRLGNGTGVSFQLVGSEVWSESALVDRTGIAAGLSVDGLRLGPFDTSFSLEAAYADYPKWILTAGGRQDRSLSGAISATYGAISVFGFSPTVVVRARQTRSSVEIFDRTELSAGLTFRSNF